MFENKEIYVGAINDKVYVSRIIASWRNCHGEPTTLFKWLISIGISEDDARYIRNFMWIGKLELEDLAKEYLTEHPWYMD